jgi:two-component system nitrate/nitrite response regulator NarL
MGDHCMRLAGERAIKQRNPLAGTSPISILIIDDVLLSREMLAQLLRNKSWAHEIMTASDAATAVHAVSSATVDVVLMSLSSREGLMTLQVVRHAAPEVPMIATAATESDDEIIACAESGVLGFVPREGSIGDIEDAVAGVIRGEAVCSPAVSAALLRRIAVPTDTPFDDSHDQYRGSNLLTPREREVLLLIERGLSNKDIARDLGIEVRTVKNHVHNLLEKLQVGRRGEAAARLRTARVPAFEVLLDRTRGSRHPLGPV